MRKKIRQQIQQMKDTIEKLEDKVANLEWEQYPPVYCPNCGSCKLIVLSRLEGRVAKIKCRDCKLIGERMIYPAIRYKGVGVGLWQWYSVYKKENDIMSKIVDICKQKKGQKDC